MKREHLAGYGILSFVLAHPLGGFMPGFVSCEGCEGNPLGRILVGLVFAVVTPLSGGFPHTNEGGVGPRLNGWPYILISFALLMAWFYWRHRNDQSPSHRINDAP